MVVGVVAFWFAASAVGTTSLQPLADARRSLVSVALLVARAGAGLRHELVRRVALARVRLAPDPALRAREVRAVPLRRARHRAEGAHRDASGAGCCARSRSSRSCAALLVLAQPDMGTAVVLIAIALRGRHGRRRAVARARAARSGSSSRGARSPRVATALPTRAAAQLPAPPGGPLRRAATSCSSPRSGSARATSSALGLGNSREQWGLLAQPAHRLHLLDHRRGARPRRRARSCSGSSSPSCSSGCAWRRTRRTASASSPRSASPRGSRPRRS